MNRKVLFRRKVVNLKLAKSIKPAWLGQDEKVSVFLASAYQIAPGNKVLATLEYNGTDFIACTEKREGLEFAFDVNQAISDILNEAYLNQLRPLTTRLRFNYRKIPVNFRVALAKRLYASRRLALEKNSFPDWPIDKSIEVLRYLQAPTEPASRESIWPQGKRFAFAVSHDLESKEGFKDLEYLLNLDMDYGFRGCWNVVAELIQGYPEKIKILQNANCEIGCHGYNHDNRLAFLPEEQMRARLQDCARYSSKYQIRGFRSPSLLRTLRLMRQLADYFDFDSSYPDTDRFSETGQVNGCCTIRPFFINGIVELPITLPMDSSMLFMGYNDEQMLEIWLKKLNWIKQRQGLALINIHCHRPFSLNTKVYAAYARLLEIVAKDSECWRTSLKDIAAHWRSCNKIEQ